MGYLLGASRAADGGGKALSAAVPMNVINGAPQEWWLSNMGAPFQPRIGNGSLAAS